MADSMKVAMLLYLKTVPGLFSTAADMKALGQSAKPLALKSGSAFIPADILSRSCTVISFMYGLSVSGRDSGKNDTTLSVNLSLFSAMASPTPMDVKLLLTENMTCFSSFLYGLHHPSEIVFPWRNITKL
jgi:hypothetical protein